MLGLKQSRVFFLKLRKSNFSGIHDESQGTGETVNEIDVHFSGIALGNFVQNASALNFPAKKAFLVKDLSVSR